MHTNFNHFSLLEQEIYDKFQMHAPVGLHSAPEYTIFVQKKSFRHPSPSAGKSGYGPHVNLAPLSYLRL